MKTIVASFEIRFNGEVADTFYFMREGNNHSTIFNNRGYLFYGDHFTACSAWKDTIDRMRIVTQIPGYEMVITK